MEIQQSLKEFGLKKSEISVFCYLLEHHHATPPQIAKGTRILRTNCYHVLASLVDQRLIREETGTSGRKIYFANDPEALLKASQDKTATIERALPDIRAMFASQPNKPTIRFYDGVKGLQEMYRSALVAKEIFAIGSTSQLEEVMPGFLEWYFTQMQKKHIILHDIVSSPSHKITRDVAITALQDYSPKFLPEKYGDLPTDMLIWDDTIALITLKDPCFATVLTNPILAKTFRMIWNLVAERLI